MFRIKRLYLYILQTFVPVFCMTFIICLFIIMMQFVWKYVEDLVGKGLEPMVIAELFTYAALNLAPMALPLAILLASLMAFGNLGERYELLAIKAAGISLLRAMRPLIILIAFISLGAFFFQDDIIPKVQVKFRALMISIRQKSPELDIPENTFYSGIDSYNLYIESKNKETGMMYNLMIYDVSKGFENMAVIVCDSGKLKMSSTKDYLLLNLYNGQQFSNFQQGGSMMQQKNPNGSQFVPYMRENFKQRKLIMPFDANFNRMDESSMDGTQISKNTAELRHSIDSLSSVIDSLNINDRRFFKNTYESYRNIQGADSLNIAEIEENQIFNYDFDSIMSSLSLQEKTIIYNDAMLQVQNNQNNMMFRSVAKMDTKTRLRQHDVELQRKFSLSFACLVFFFIGAPLGAIIRKGGLGMPVVVSVAMFIVYYIIDNLGYKMAKDGVWEVWQGVWLSSFILFPLGLFITYKAIKDSALFNPEAYGNYFRKILFIQKPAKATEEIRDAFIARIPDVTDLVLDPTIVKSMEAMDSDNLRGILDNSREEKEKKQAALSILKSRGADINSFIDQQNIGFLKTNLTLFSKSSVLTGIAYVILLAILLLKIPVIILVILYSVLFLRTAVYYFNFYGTVNRKSQILNVFIIILSYAIFPITFGFVRKRMVNYIKRVQIIF